MVAMSMPSTVSQACIACPVSASGRPEAKPSSVTAASRCSEAARCASEAEVPGMESKASEDLIGMEIGRGERDAPERRATRDSSGPAQRQKNALGALCGG